MVPFLLWSLVSRWAPIFIVVCSVGWFLPALLGVFCFSFIVTFWRTRSILLQKYLSIYNGGVINFWQLTAMFYCSLGYVLICRCTTFWRLLAILFYLLVPFLYLTFYFSYLVLQTGVSHVYIFLYSLYQTCPRILLRRFFSSSPIPTLYAIIILPLYFLPPPMLSVVQVYISLYFLALMVDVPYFGVVAFVFWGPLFGVLLVLFEPISLLLVS